MVSKKDKRNIIIVSVIIALILLVINLDIKSQSTVSSAVFSLNKGGESFKLIGEEIYPFAVLFDRQCTSDSGFNICYEVKQEEIYGDARAEAYAKVQTTDPPKGLQKGDYWVGKVFLPVSLVGDNFYLYENIISWDSIWNQCNEDGCSGYKNIISSTDEYILANPGQEYNGCPAFVSFDYDRNDASNGDWAIVWTGKGYGWVGNSNCLNIKSVNCIDNSDCNSGQVCDKSGDWRNWNCKTSDCQLNQEKCEGTEWFTCTPDNTWGSQGQVSGKCGYNSPQNKTIYRLENNICTPILITQTIRALDVVNYQDFDSLEECNSNIQPKDNLLWIILGSSAIIGGLGYLYTKTKKRR